VKYEGIVGTFGSERCELPTDVRIQRICKTRQGRSTIVVQCGKFPVDLDGTGVLEEVHEFLEKRFRQHIRLQADAGDLEIVEIL
jgi:hypothetical protein